jgi:ubiquinone/menaquinone biosynthesis C-methylase UbiE
VTSNRLVRGLKRFGGTILPDISTSDKGNAMIAVEEAVCNYILGAEEHERSRLLLQGEIHRAEAEQLLARLSLPVGGRALDLGCGPLGILDMLSAAVGPDGTALGIDNEPRMIARAHNAVSERRLANVELALAEATDTGLEADSMDIAHERLVLINHRSPRGVIDEMARVVAPDGWVLLQEVDCDCWCCEPGHSAWDELYAAWTETLRAEGLDPFIGRRLPPLLRAAGLRDVGFDLHAYHWGAGHPYKTLLLHFTEVLRPHIVEHRALSTKRLALLEAELAQHLAKPETFVIHPLFCQAWGRR